MDEKTRYEDAKKRVEDLRGFYYHLVSFIAVSAVLVIINLLTSPGYLWFIWALLGWGSAIFIHGFSIYGNIWGKSWEERKIKEIMEKDRLRDGR